MILESRIEREACVKVKTELGIESLKLKGLRGYPDRIFLIPGGRPLLIEFKRPGERPRPDQQLRIHQLQDLGYHVEVHDTVESAFAAVRYALQATGVPA